MSVLLVILGVVALGGLSALVIIFSKKNRIKKEFSYLKDKFQMLNKSNLESKINKLKSISENNKEYVDVYESIKVSKEAGIYIWGL